LYRHRPFIIQSLIAASYFTAIGIMPFLSLKASQAAGMPVTQVGILFTIGAVVNAVLLVPMGRVADRKSKKVLMTLGLLITGASMAGIAVANDFAQLAVAQVVGSAGGSMFGPAAVALLSENVPLRRQSTAMGIYGGCEDIGIIIGSAAGGAVWSTLGPTPTFLLVGTVPAALGAIICFAMLKGRTGRDTLAPATRRGP
jgi:MFS family permease